MPDDIPTSPVTLEEYADLSMEERRQVWLDISDITKDEFEAHMAEEKERETDVPQVGSMAPDFTVDVLNSERKYVGETVTLSDLRGKPVGLIFGSFT